MPRPDTARPGTAVTPPRSGAGRSLIRLGRARVATRDCLCGPYTEIQIYDSQWPPHA